MLAMKAMRVILICALVAVAAIGIVAYVGFRSFDSSMCGVSVVRRMTSPDGRLEAVVFERDCGATTEFATQLSVVQAGTAIKNDVGNLLMADSDHGRASLDSGNVIHLRVEWVGSDSLVVRYDRRARIFRQNKRANGVSVSYAAIGEPGA
jgi:hypothetical protein